jgi:uncharacterized protein (UPF0264 family)
VRGASDGDAGSGVILVGYADAARVGSLPYAAVTEIAAAVGARGVLVDTALKGEPGLLALVDPDDLTEWVGAARRESLLVALAGKLTAADLAVARRTGADVVGVRGAACEGGRGGRVSATLVRALRALCVGSEPALPAASASGPLDYVAQ